MSKFRTASAMMQEWEESSKRMQTEAEIRADERNKTIEEMAYIIRSEEADTSQCWYKCRLTDDDISCTQCIFNRAIMRMKEGEKE